MTNLPDYFRTNENWGNTCARFLIDKDKPEERIEIFQPGLSHLQCPVLRVTEEHRLKWPKQYQAFRAKLSWWIKFRLWLRNRREARFKPQPVNPAYDAAFAAWAKETLQQREAMKDNTVRADLLAALKDQEKA